MRSIWYCWVAVVTCLGAQACFAGGGNRLTYLDSDDPYYVSRTFPKLITPMWVGEEGVDAVIVLAIDDMRGHEKWEAFLRPVLERLKQIDGRAPVSIMTCQIKPDDPHLQQWLKEGLSLEAHTYDHPCPLMADGNFERAKATYDRCVDQMFDVPGNTPVAFRMPCCDSMDTPSPRFWAEIFNKTTGKGRFLEVDSSVFNIVTPNDPALPREVVFEKDGRERFRKYLPFKSFVNTIEDYPYPYVINRLCWEFPCVVPSDWEGFNIQKAYNPVTVADMKAAIDATVIKRGTFNLVFHPHGWIKPEQIVELIDHATGKYGKRVKFLTFREAHERLTKNLLGGQRLRTADGGDNGVRLMDLNGDGFIDVVIANERVRQTRVWSPERGQWVVSDFPVALVKEGKDAGVRFGVIEGAPVALVRSESAEGAWRFDGAKWVADSALPKTAEGAWRFDGARWVADAALLKGLEADGPVLTAREGRDQGVRLRDLDGDGRCELLVGNVKQRAVFRWSGGEWVRLPFALPEAIVDAEGRDAGLRFVDVNEDGHPDVIFSNDDHYSLHLFKSMSDGWATMVIEGKHDDRPMSQRIPKIVRNGTNNGMWVHSRSLWWRNESTSAMPDKVDRRSFGQLLGESDPTARSAEASLKSIHVKPGFTVELMAAEPLVQDPIAFAFGPDGKLWVVEMGDYPLGVDGKGKPGGRVKFLESSTGDGHYDKATVFLDELPFPTGVLPWRKGVLVTCAPDIFYAEDTDGDGKADKREVLYTGFKEGNQQHRVNTLAWGLDNWIYCANGHSGGQVKSMKTGEVVNISGRDLRIKPDEGLIEAVTGVTQYGRARDDWGNWFGNDNSNPMYQFVLEDHYVRRNPYVAPPPPRVDLPVRPGAAPVYPISRTLARFNDLYAANHFTSANSAIVYRDELFGPFSNSTFVSEPVHNLVHREALTRKGVTYSTTRPAGEEESEFLASSDNWLRPTMLQTGPDGALWIADMYRAVIEHPEWIPKDWQKRLDLRAGHELGRIYRVYPVDQRPREIPRMDKLDTAGLVAALESPSGWQRDMAQMLLVQRGDPVAVALLREQVAHGSNPQCRMQALCTLEGLGALDEGTVMGALKDGHWGVRKQAVRVAEPLLAQSSRVAEALAGMVGDDDPQVRMQLGYSLGYSSDPVAARALGELAVRDTGEPYITAAVLSSISKANFDAVAATVIGDRHAAPSAALLAGLARSSIAYGRPGAGLHLLASVAGGGGDRAESRFVAAAEMLDALEQSGRTLRKLSSGAASEDVAEVAKLFESAREMARDATAPTAARVAAARLLGRGDSKQAEDVEALTSFLSPQNPIELQAAALETLALRRETKTPAILLAGWKGYGPGLRAQVIDVLVSRPEGTVALLDAIEHRRVLATEIDPARRARLLQQRDKALRDRAVKLLAVSTNPDRAKVVEAYRAALTLSGDAGHGRELFAKTCATCHRLGDVGAAVGPDLASIGDKSPQTLLVSILDPNAAVEPRYVNYLAETKNGDSYSGVLVSESGNSVTIAVAGGEQKTLLRGDIKTLRSTGLSLMPEGLEAGMSPQDVADLIAAVRASGPPRQRKQFDGNEPAVVQADEEGAIHLLPKGAEIYGKTLVLETKYANLGFWMSGDDEAVWTAQVPKAGRYSVTLHYACEDDSAGSAYVVQSGAAQFTGVVEGTGTWDHYRKVKVGEIDLAAGKQQIVVRPVGKPNDALMDLKEVDLAMVK